LALLAKVIRLSSSMQEFCIIKTFNIDCHPLCLIPLTTLELSVTHKVQLWLGCSSYWCYDIHWKRG